MAHTTLMNIFNARDQLQIELASLLLGQPSVTHDVIEQLAAIAVLHDHVELFFRLNNFVQLDDIGVADLLENFNFPRDTLDVFLIVNLVFLEDFDSDLHKFKLMFDEQFCENFAKNGTYLLACQRVLAQLDLAERALTQMFTYN